LTQIDEDSSVDRLSVDRLTSKNVNLAKNRQAVDSFKRKEPDTNLDWENSSDEDPQGQAERDDLPKRLRPSHSNDNHLEHRSSFDSNTVQPHREKREYSQFPRPMKLTGQQIIEVDYMYLPEDSKGNKYICVIIDTFTRFVQLEAVTEKSGNIFAGILLKLYSNFGLPKYLRHDGGTEFDNEVIRTINQTLKIKDHTTTPYRYQSHGIVERANQTCLRHLRLLCHRLHKKTEWATLLPLVQHVVNSVPSTITGFAPKDLLLGPFNQNDSDDNLWPIGETERIIDIPEFVKEMREVQEQLVNQARSNNLDYIKTMDQRAKDRGIDRKATKYKVNDLVYTTRRRFEQQADKLSPLLFGPFKIVKVKDNESRYTLQSLISEEHTFESHISDLREFQYNKSDELPEMLARTDNEETLVLQVLDHKLGKNEDGTPNLQLNEFLLMFEDGDQKCIPHSEARNVELVIDYAKEHAELKAKYQRQQANENITDIIAPARMDLSRPSTQTKHNTRNRNKTRFKKSNNN
jgi:hypothetical protein